MAEYVGKQLGNYRIMRLLGRGGFADVYLGEHIFLKTHVAVKILHKSMQPNILQTFLTEAQTIARLRNPHIVQILDFGVENDAGIPFLVMHYAPKGTLRDLHPEGSTVPLATVIAYTKQIATALQHAHDQKLIHQDVKPENMLLGDNNEVMLSDFGVVAVVHSTASLKTGASMGTIHYMAPEQINGKPRPASDQYALGYCCLRMALRQPPLRRSAAHPDRHATPHRNTASTSRQSFSRSGTSHYESYLQKARGPLRQHRSLRQRTGRCSE